MGLVISGGPGQLAVKAEAPAPGIAGDTLRGFQASWGATMIAASRLSLVRADTETRSCGLPARR